MPVSRARGRPLSFDRDAALDRVLPVFWSRGFAAPSLDELAAAAGLNRPNLTAAFGDKQGLYLASLDRFLSKFAIGASKALDAPGSLRTSLDRFFEFAVSLYAEQGLGCFVFATAPAASNDIDVRAALARALTAVQTIFEQRVTSSVGKELVPDVDAEGLAIVLSGVLLSLALHARAGLRAADLRAMHKRAVSIILRGAAVA